MDWQNADLSRDFISGTVAPESFKTSYHIAISDGEVLCINGQYPWRPLDQDEWRWCGLTAQSSHYLGNLGIAPIFVEELDPEADEPDGHGFETLWSFLSSVDMNVFYLIGRAKQIIDWRQQHQFCGRCGTAMSIAQSDRSMKCEKCNIPYYPKLSPSIIVLINKGKELLLARNSKAPGKFFSTLAGFVEPGESIEETVHREVFEEVGVKVKNLKYYNSQSWPFPNSLMLGFHAEYESGEIVLQEEEIAEADWFHYTSMPNKPAMMSISGWLVDDFIKRMS